eukprot:TRINITY_DN4883_c0_g1_i1.p1 TRINITY_DN4883_c0_g1~~TRINITY_DN4883_c0_g1_i1.p1  ORF type:complete len:632 (+),score=224.63 TRINITY_DN4883_c0_g1_i1:39-1934(+)
MQTQEVERTFGHQDSLQPLPVPTLADTCAKYIKSVEPLLADSPKDMEATRAAVEEFQAPGGWGEQLQAMLEQRAANSRNWLEEWWEKYAYLTQREPTTINTNIYGSIFDDLPVHGSISQTQSAAAIIYFFLRFKHMIDTQKLPAERGVTGSPLCMDQYARMFGECRIPGDPEDHLENTPNSRHVAVLVRNQVYTFDVYEPTTSSSTKDSKMLSPNDIEHQLKIILQHSAKPNWKDIHPVSILTSENRSTWANAREQLIGYSRTNEESLRLIQSSLFTLQLDVGGDLDEQYGGPSGRNQLSNALFVGDGLNRWFDKSLHVTVFQNGKAGLNCDHSWADAIVIVRLTNYVMDIIRKGDGVVNIFSTFPPARGNILQQPRQLHFSVPTAVAEMIQNAKENLQKLAATYDMKILRFTGYGKKDMKVMKFHPDTTVQMALQLAYYNMFGRPTATYETAHTRMFYHGRTETIRVCSSESLAWTKAMADPNASQRERYDLFQKATTAHEKYINMCLFGHGIDRHLMGLRILAAGTIAHAAQQGKKLEMPKIFTDNSYALSSTFGISSSNIGYGESFGGFGPVFEKGFGCCYTIQGFSINMSVSARTGVEGNNVPEFIEHVKNALFTIIDLVLPFRSKL